MPVPLALSVSVTDGLHEQYKSTKDIVKIHAKGSDVGTTMYGNTNCSQSVCHRLVVCGPTHWSGLGLGLGRWRCPDCRLPQSAPFLAQQASSITLPINYLRSFEKRILGEATSIGTSKNATYTHHFSLSTIHFHKMAEDPECTTRELVFIDINKEGATGISIYWYQ